MKDWNEMKELKFEDKDTWVELKVDKFKHMWDSNKLDHRDWSQEVSGNCSEALKEISVTVDDKKRKLEMFFQAKGMKNKTSFYNVFFRDMPFFFSDEATSYINETINEAEDYFQTSFDEFRSKIN